MRQTGMIALVVLLFVGLHLGAGLIPGAGSAAAQDEAPEPAKALKQITKSLASTTKKSGFSLHCDVKVATISGKTRDIETIYRFSVQQLYDATVYQGAMRIGEPDAYRTLKGSAIRDEGGTVWRKTSSTKVGRMVEQFLHFPHVLLKEAQKKPRSVSWDSVPTEKPKSPKKEKGEGHTGVADGGGKKSLPNLLRIELSPKVATKRLKDSIDSGIFDKATGCSLTQFLAAMDRSVAEGTYEITLDSDRNPSRLRMVLRTAFLEDQSTTEEEKNLPIHEQRHFLFEYVYKLDNWGDVERFVIPEDARRLLR